AQPQPVQERREAITQSIELCVRKLAAIEDDAGLVGRSACPFAQVLGDRLPAKRKMRLTRDALGPVRLPQALDVFEVGVQLVVVAHVSSPCLIRSSALPCT